MRGAVRLWFSFAEPVGRGAYFWNGAALMAFKYAVDAAVISRATHRFWTPLDYLNPLWSRDSSGRCSRIGSCRPST